MPDARARVRTLVLSDLHLGSRTKGDILRRADVREALIAALRAEPPDRLVLLGDVLELRHGPVREALEAARPTLEAIAAALPAHAEVTVVPGNHDHALVAPWLERRALAGAGPMALEQRIEPSASPAMAALAEMLAPAKVEMAYPGIWLREDVYALHGHYIDRHVTTPRSERLAAGAMARVMGALPARPAPDDYEAVLAPIYAWLHVVARYSTKRFGVKGTKATVGAWQVLNKRGPRPPHHYAIAAAFPLAVALVNRLGLGPVGTDVSATGLRRAGLAAMGEVCRQLQIDAAWVVFGHTHRAGPKPRDDLDEWRSPVDGQRLANAGCWVHERAFVRGAGPHQPYWPGGCIELVDGEPPRWRNLLAEWRAAPMTAARRPP